MAENSGIEWTDHTFNPWIGCTKISPACDHCYAERTAARMQVQWGAGAPRKRTGEAYWREPLKWNRRAAATGRRERVFCASLADVFDIEVPQDWREDLWELIDQTPHLDWLLLTKRIGNVHWMTADMGALPDNVWLGITVVTQKEADRDVPKLLAVPARVRFLSMEPLLGPVDLYRGGWSLLRPRRAPPRDGFRPERIHWVIAGGESGPQARPSHPDWFRGLRDQCVAAGVPFFFKQWGEWGPPTIARTNNHGEEVIYRHRDMTRWGKKNAGRLLDGRTWDEVPASGDER